MDNCFWTAIFYYKDGNDNRNISRTFTFIIKLIVFQTKSIPWTLDANNTYAE